MLAGINPVCFSNIINLWVRWNPKSTWTRCSRLNCCAARKSAQKRLLITPNLPSWGEEIRLSCFSSNTGKGSLRMPSDRAEVQPDYDFLLMNSLCPFAPSDACGSLKPWNSSWSTRRFDDQIKAWTVMKTEVDGINERFTPHRYWSNSGWMFNVLEYLL